MPTSLSQEMASAKTQQHGKVWDIEMRGIWALSMACLLAVSGCSKKQVEHDAMDTGAQKSIHTNGDVNSADAQTKQGETQANAQVGAPSAEVLPLPPVIPMPEPKPVVLSVTADELQKMAPEAAEAALTAGFGKISEAEASHLQMLKDRASIGDDRAKEEFALTVLKEPHTHPEYASAIKFLRTVREYKDPEAMMQRGLFEWQVSMGSPEGVERAKVYFAKAAELNHEKTLEFLLRNGAFGMQADAFKRLNAIYEERAKDRDPKVLYEWARLMEFAPPAMQPVADALIQEASNAGYAPAMHAWSITLMAREKNWDAGYALLKKAALAGSSNASMQLATLYTIAHYSDSLEMAHEMGGSSLTASQYEELRRDVTALGDPKMHIVNYSMAASGFDEACTLLLAIAANEDTTPATLKARDAAIDCIDRFVAAAPTRDACDRAYDQLTYAENKDLDFTHVFSDAQRAMMGKIILKCYGLALERGENYPKDQPYVGFSTALQIAVLYAGNHALKIAPDGPKQLQYITYAATRGDVLGQTILAQHYVEGNGVAQNPERACYWRAQTVNSDVCRVFCSRPEVAELGTCKACADVAVALQNCAKGK